MTADGLAGAPLTAAQVDDLEERLRRFDGYAWDAGPVFAVIAALRAAWRERTASEQRHAADSAVWTEERDRYRTALMEIAAGTYVHSSDLAKVVYDHARAALGAPGARETSA